MSAARGPWRSRRASVSAGSAAGTPNARDSAGRWVSWCRSRPASCRAIARVRCRRWARRPGSPASSWSRASRTPSGGRRAGLLSGWRRWRRWDSGPSSWGWTSRLGRGPWTIVAARTGGVATLLVAAAFARPSMRIEPALLPSLFAIGLFDVLANSLFAVATNHGLLSLVAVAGSLYSAVTVLLARFVLRERLAPSQRGGVVVALAGVALIAAGAG